MIDTVICGDAAEVMAGMPDESVQLCVTSPPYYGLRDYGTAKWEGGDPECDHKKGQPSWRSRDKSTIGFAESQGHNLESWGRICSKCGAIRIDKQIGLEETPEIYVEKLVAVFREMRRVLKNDGVLWLNMGDSYWGSSQNGGDQTKRVGGGIRQLQRQQAENRNVKVAIPPNCKPKDLMGIPWLLAFALRTDGFWLRQDIIWAKPNPMPESVTDRCTKAHEYIFLLTKSARYYYNAEAIVEKSIWAGIDKRSQVKGGVKSGGKTATGQYAIDKVAYREDGNRNRRSVWTIPTKPFKGSHFATFPPELPRLCILAGSRPGDTILDPFCGSGTTLAVAKELGRHWIGIDVSEKYCALSRRHVLAARTPLPPPF